MLHIHVLLVAPLGASYMAEPGTDQHQSRIAIREAAHYSGAAADLPVEPFHDIVGANICPVLAGEIAVNPYYLRIMIPLYMYNQNSFCYAYKNRIKYILSIAQIHQSGNNTAIIRVSMTECLPVRIIDVLDTYKHILYLPHKTRANNTIYRFLLSAFGTSCGTI